jgi:site-specific DNA-cytosine methylase
MGQAKVKPTFGSLFAGVGGFDMGMEQAGWECKFQVEWDKYCRNVLDHNWSDIPKWGDVRNVDGRFLPPVDCIIFGSPCQDMSQQAGSSKLGLDGSKSGLFYEAMRIIKEMRNATNGTFPRWAIWENVAGALNSNRGADFGKVLDTMAEAGSVVIEWKLLDSKYFGIPQARRRIFLVSGFVSDSTNPSATQIFPVNQSTNGHIHTGDQICFYQTHGRLDQFAVGISPPLKANMVVCVASEVLKPRTLMPSECEKLMGFPDEHTRWGADGSQISDTQRYKMCGNSVVVPVATWVGERLMDAHVANYPATPITHT